MNESSYVKRKIFVDNIIDLAQMVSLWESCEKVERSNGDVMILLKVRE